MVNLLAVMLVAQRAAPTVAQWVEMMVVKKEMNWAEMLVVEKVEQ